MQEIRHKKTDKQTMKGVFEMAYRDYIKSEQQKWIGRTVYYEGQRYLVVDVDYNGGLLINKPTMFTDTTAVESWQVIYDESRK